MRESSSIDSKSIGTLIDELIIINIRIWMAIERLTSTKIDNQTPPEVCRETAELAQKIQKYNAKRVALLAMIDNRLGDAYRTVEEKTYGTS